MTGLSARARDAAERLLPWLAFLVTVNSVALCFAHYFSFRSLWLDEAFVAVNVRDASISSLFGPLEYGQQFPRIYLSAVLVLTKVFGYEVWSLRLLPFLFGIISVAFGAWVFWKEFRGRERGAALASAAVLIYLGNHFLYYYAGEFKQYSADVAWALYGVWFGRARMSPERHDGHGAFVRDLFLWLFPILVSMTYVFVAGSVVVVLWGRRLASSGKNDALRLGSLAGVTIFFAAIAYAVDLRDAQNGSLAHYWRNFFIGGETPAQFVASLWRGVSNVAGRWWIEPLAPVFTVLALLGMGRAWVMRSRGRDASFLAAVGGVLLIILMVLAAAKKYPLEYGRTALFFFPFACAGIVEGISFFLESRRSFMRLGGAAALAAIVLLMVGWKTFNNSRYNYRLWHWENLNEAMAAIDSKGDCLVVYGSGAVAQVRAFPRLPEKARFISYTEVDSLASEFAAGRRSGGFYFLIGVPNSEENEILARLNRVRPFEMLPAADHLLFFRPQ